MRENALYSDLSDKFLGLLRREEFPAFLFMYEKVWSQYIFSDEKVLTQYTFSDEKV